VIPYFTRWLDEFPDPRALAGAQDDVVHKAWEGLGYYRRARYLKAAAVDLVAEGWPGDLEGLAKLPGLGPYTAAAVGSIAFQWPTPALDGNAFRVLARLLLLEGDPKDRAADLRVWLVPALEALGPSRLTQALMELGATICSPTPACGGCPLSDRCCAHRAARTGDIPPVAKRAKPKASTLWLVAFEAEEHLLLHTPAAKGLLAGLWRWPTFDVTTFPSPSPRVRSPSLPGPAGPRSTRTAARLLIPCTSAWQPDFHRWRTSVGCPEACFRGCPSASGTSGYGTC